MIDALLGTLERDAEAEIASVLADGRARAAAVATESDRRIADWKRTALGRCEAEGRAALERSLAAARVRARGRVLAAREALLQRVFAALRGCLPEIAATEAYRDGLAADVRRTVTFAGERPVTLHCAPTLAPLLRRLVKTNGRLRVEADATIAAGYRIVTVDGGLEVDGTLEGAIERLRPRLALDALAALGVSA